MNNNKNSIIDNNIKLGENIFIRKNTSEISNYT